MVWLVWLVSCRWETWIEGSPAIKAYSGFFLFFYAEGKVTKGVLFMFSASTTVASLVIWVTFIDQRMRYGGVDAKQLSWFATLLLRLYVLLCSIFYTWYNVEHSLKFTHWDWYELNLKDALMLSVIPCCRVQFLASLSQSFSLLGQVEWIYPWMDVVGTLGLMITLAVF